MTNVKQETRPFRFFIGDFLRYAGRQGWVLGVYLVFGALVEGIGVLLLLPLLSVVIGSGTGNRWVDGITSSIVAFAPGDSKSWQLAFVLALFALLISFRAFIILNRDILMERLQTGFVEALRLSIVSALANSRWDIVARLKHGRITHILGQDVDECGNAAFLILRTAVAVALLTGQWTLIFILSPKLAGLVLLLLIVAALALRPLLRRSTELGSGLAESNLGMIVETGQFLGGLKLALSQNLQHSFLKEFRRVRNEAIWRRIAFTRQRTTTQLMLTAFVALVGGLVILIGVGFLDTPPAVLFAFLFVLARLSGPVGQIQASAQQIFHSLPTYRKVKELQGELADRTPAREHIEQQPIKWDRLQLDDVSFIHAGTEGAGVSHFSMEIAPGEMVGLSGPSGAGKTTLADLVVGLYSPQSGAILLNEKPLGGPPLGAWRASLGYVSQDPFLFHDSIRRNLLWARPEASDDDMWEALELADADRLVRQLPAGLDSVVGERGALLSGGERQRIALARALIRRPSFLLLDEASSAIDLASERRILGRLRALSPRPAILIIAHRGESLGLCDHVIELDGGKLCIGIAQ
ncbi:MAG TPA: ABC transporter ATP-binding protein [Sphingomicrobium sp.]|nr:ABC transporter ATP-binding protein [Sphingomicrobium sp.]